MQQPKFPSTFGSFNAHKPEPQKQANVLGYILTGCVALAAVMLTVKLGLVLFT